MRDRSGRADSAQLPPQLQKDRHQNPCADPQDRTNGHRSVRIVGLEEAADGTHPKNRQAKHHGHGERSEAEAAHVGAGIGHAFVSPEADRGRKALAARHK
jgi:hypothetical protein